MSTIQPVSALRNYKQVLDEVSFGHRVHLTKNGSGSVVLIDEKELEMLDNMAAKMTMLEKLDRSVRRANSEGWIPSEQAEAIWEEDE